MEENVIAKTIIGFPKYTVDIYGNVFSYISTKCRKLRPSRNTYGYLQVYLYNQGEKKYALVSRLVAEAFIGSLTGLQVNHKDGNKLNNTVSNLEIVTASENIVHALHTGLHPDLRRPVMQTKKNGVLIHVYESILSASKFTDIHRGHICEVVNGKRKTAGGFVWTIV